MAPDVLKEFRWKKKGLSQAILMFVSAIWLVVFLFLPYIHKTFDKAFGHDAWKVALSICIALSALFALRLLRELYLYSYRDNVIRITKEGIFYSHRGLKARTVKWTSIREIVKDSKFHMDLLLTDGTQFSIFYGFYFKRGALRRILHAIIEEKKSPAEAVYEG